MDVDLSEDERKRYAPQISSSELGSRRQETLKQARALVFGGGRVGSAVAAQLASSGVGYLGVADGGTVGEEDLSSQSVHFTPDVGTGKADSVAGKLGVLNPEVQVDSFPVNVTLDNCEAIVAGHDLVVACVGGLATRLAVNDECVASGTVLIDCIANGSRGAVQTILPGETACLRCSAFEANGAGVAAGLAGAIGALGAIEAIDLLSGRGVLSKGRIELDLEAGSIEVVPLRREASCAACRLVSRSAGSIAQEVHA